jgi:HEAT repeat protein
MPAPPAPPAPPAAPKAPKAPAPPVVISGIDLRIQALSSLMSSHAERVIPLLKEMVYEVQSTEEARRALFVLARSNRPEARTALVEVARKGPEPVRIAAVREMSYVGWPDVSQVLLVVYSDGTRGVRRQVVRTLGQRGSAEALAEIAKKEADRELRDQAIIMIGRAGGRQQLRLLYDSAGPDAKEPVIAAFFNAGADEDLIRVARQESNGQVRQLAIEQLRLLDTEKARAFLASLK